MVFVSVKIFPSTRYRSYVQLYVSQEQALVAAVGAEIEPDDYKFYIGLNSIQTEAVWVWGDRQEPVTYTYWGNNQPNDFINGKDEDCVVLVSDVDHTWHDIPCPDPAHAICKLNVTSVKS